MLFLIPDKTGIGPLSTVEGNLYSSHGWKGEPGFLPILDILQAGMITIFGPWYNITIFSFCH